MQPLNDFLIKPNGGSKFDNVVRVGNFEFIKGTNEEDATIANRIGVVVETPYKYNGEIKKGSLVVVHHNTFRHGYDMKGLYKHSSNYFKDDIYAVDEPNIYLYKTEGDWIANDRYCFVEPILAKKRIIHAGNRYEPLIGKIKYPSKKLLEWGILSGDKVMFTPDSEYEFEIDGELMYRVYEHQITAKFN
jgi:hypothetical protein